MKDLTNDHEFIVIACDGIWDVLSNQDVVEFVRDRLAQKTEPDQVGLYCNKSATISFIAIEKYFTGLGW